VVPSFVAAVRANRGHDSLPFTGQSAGLVHEVLPAAEIIRRLVAETEASVDSAKRAAST
jgi:enoyl-[acyl-carrier protein] reductase II